MNQAIPRFQSTAPTVSRINPRDPAVARQVIERLVATGQLDRLVGDRALQAQRQTNERIDVVIVQLGLQSEGSLLETLSQYFGYPVASAAQFPSAPVLPEVLTADFLRQCRMLPIEASGTHVTIVVADPFYVDFLAAIAYRTDRQVKAMIAAPKDVDEALERLYGNKQVLDEPASAPQEAAQAQEDDVQRLRDIASEAPIIRLVSRLISQAIAQRASDIHIEPFADAVRVRYRVDGVMAEIERFGPEMHAGIASRIKILGHLNIAERRLPQDGRTKFVLGGREIDLRISTTPLLHGEKIVMRILDRDAVDLDFASLGFEDKGQAQLKRLLEAPNGIVLVTGPTGSGKTTTLYTALKMLNSVERNVFTVEDPIEYQLVGVNQMQIKPAIGLDFVHCLRSILRQDPDVVMIGEMRDVETARTGIQASLTGHLVLSTLHTNSAAASIARLLDMGVEDYLLASTISGILAQRLVRRLCQSCCVPVRDPQEITSALNKELAAFVEASPVRKLMQPAGCPACRHTGFNGRTTIYEILEVDDRVRRRIVRGVNDREIEETAIAGGMETLVLNGLRKALAGETTVAEVLRAARM